MIQEVKNLLEFQNIERSWDDLYQRSMASNLFLTHTWLSLWIKHFGDGQTFALLHVPDGGLRPEAGVILKRYNKTVGFIETDFSSYPDFLATPHSTDSIQNLLAYLKGNYLPSKLIFAGAGVNSALCKNINMLAKDHWLAIFKYPSRMRSIILSGTFDSYLKSQGAKFRSETRRKVRRAYSNYRVSLRTFSLGAEKAELFETIRLIEQDSWKTQEGSAIINNQKQLHFYGDVFESYAEHDQAMAYVLYFDGQPVSFILGILSDHTYYALKTSYRLLYREFSPGLVLFAKVIESLFKGKEAGDRPRPATQGKPGLQGTPAPKLSSARDGALRPRDIARRPITDDAEPIDGHGLAANPCCRRAAVAAEPPGTSGHPPMPEVNRLEFLGSDARWKEEFANHQEDVCTLELLPMGLKSLSYHMFYRYARPLVKRLLRIPNSTVADGERLIEGIVNVNRKLQRSKNYQKDQPIRDEHFS